jgi:hypothetical protein
MMFQSHAIRPLPVFLSALVRACVVSTLLLSFTAQSSSVETKLKEIKGEATNSIISLVPLDEATFLIESDVVGQLTHFGKFTGNFSYVAVMASSTIGLTGSATFTNHKGDKLFLTADIIERGATSPYLVEGTLTITGGTGEFANATGSIDVSGLDNEESLTDTLELRGALSVMK